MLDKSTMGLQTPHDQEQLAGSLVIERRGQLIKERLHPEQYRNIDKQTLERFLKLGIADVLAQGHVINLDTNEELPRLIPILCAYFSLEELTQLVGGEVTATMLKMHRTEVLQNLFLEVEFQKVLVAFNAAHIQLLLFKGPALAYTVYPDAQLRTYHDIDALIHSADLERARELLTRLGYTYYEEFRANVVNDKRTGYNFTLERPDSWLEVLIELHTAPHASEIGTDFDIDALWSQAQPITVLGEPTLTMDALDHLLYLCWHYRFHAFSRLLWLYDIVVMLRSQGTRLDWEMLVQKAIRQHLATTLYYCLSWSRDLFSVEIPEQVFQQLFPPLICRLIVEAIAMPDVARSLATAQGQPRRILAHRAMADDMRGLLQSVGRTLFPTPAAIGQRYMEHSRLPLHLYFLYYFIHPWTTLAKGICYLLPSRRGRGKRVQ